MRSTLSWRDKFIGHRIYSPTAGSNVGHNWRITQTVTAGTPTYAPVSAATDSPNGALAVALSSNNEIQNVCVSWSDLLQIDIARVREINMRVKLNQAALTSGTSFAIGLASARNDAIASITACALFRLVAATSTTALVIRTTDGTNTQADVATGTTLVNAYKDLKISFATGRSDVRFFVDGQPVAESTTFNLSAYTGCFQPFIQIQKTATTAVDGFTVCDFSVDYQSHN
jgi:hypothetical protein